MNSTAVKPPVAPTKLCHLIKRPDFEGYGFNLHSEKLKPGQFIGKVDAGSPAENAGLKKGDRIVEVNGVSIGNETHKQVVQRIKAIENEVRLLLIDVDGLTPTTVESLQKQSPDGINIDENDGRAGEGITHISNNNNNNKNRNNDETSTKTQNQHNNNNNNDKNLSNSSLSTLSTTITTNTTTTTTTTTTVVPTTITSSSASSQQQQHNNNGNTLHLPLTAAEMRAKLMSKKKYDPKSESVDIKKKFQIIQTL